MALVFGNRRDNTLEGTDARDLFLAGRGDDTIHVSGGDLVLGGRGFDTAVFDGSIFDFDISGWWRTMIVKELDAEGSVLAVNRLKSVEALQFDDFVFNTKGDNAVLFTGDDSGAVTEDAGTPATGTLTATDFDGNDGILAAAGTTAFGSYAIGTDGVWTYTLADGNATVDALNTGDMLADSFEIVAEDGTTQTVTIDITGVNDAATFGGELSGGVTEDAGVAATGTATVSDVDAGQGSIVASSGTTAYGSYAIGTDGVWTYTLDDTNPTVDALAAGDPLTDSFSVFSDDGTEQVIAIDITGADDNVPVIYHLNGRVFDAVDGVVENFVYDRNFFSGSAPASTIRNFTVGEDRLVFTNFRDGSIDYDANLPAFSPQSASAGIEAIEGSAGTINLFNFEAFFTVGGPVSIIRFTDANGIQEDEAFVDSVLRTAGPVSGQVAAETVPLEDLADDDLIVFYVNDLILA